MTVLQFAEEIKRLDGFDAPIEFRPLPEDDPKVRRPDILESRWSSLSHKALHNTSRTRFRYPFRSA